MKTYCIVVPLLALSYLQHAVWSTTNQPCAIDPPGIRIEFRVPRNQLKDSGRIVMAEAEYSVSAKHKEFIQHSVNNVCVIEENIQSPCYINFDDLLTVNKKKYYLVEPGDDIIITSTTSGFAFSGTGATKYRLQYEIDSVVASIPLPNNKPGKPSFFIDSIGEYYAFTKYFQKVAAKVKPVFEVYKNQVPPTIYQHLSDRFFKKVVADFAGKFHSMLEYGVGQRKIAPDSLVQLYDSIYAPSAAVLLEYTTNKMEAAKQLQTTQIRRAFGFDPSRMPSNNDLYMLLARDQLKTFKGKERERYLSGVLPKLFTTLGYTPEVRQLLEEFYASADSVQTQKMKNEEDRTRKMHMSNRAPDFSLAGVNGELISRRDFKRKLTVLHFETEGKANSNPLYLQTAMEQFSNDTNVVFIHVSAEKDHTAWRKSVGARKKSNRQRVIYAHAGKHGTDHPIFTDYTVNSSQNLWVIDSNGRVANSYPFIDLRDNDGSKLKAFIQNRLDRYENRKQRRTVIKQDGPYVLYSNNGTMAYYFDSVTLNKVSLENKNAGSLQVQTDLVNVRFPVVLQQSLSNQPSIFPAVNKLLAFSDIEGNFDALRLLLLNNKVIDKDFNWTFGNGHIVFAGDMFDRGRQVTECLWLLYGLEEKAKKAGGYVHFILGNHEIMNMAGNHSYASSKYSRNAKILNKSLRELYDEHTELGRWLRTKNVIEKIGDLLFVHGGISPEVNSLPLTIDEINNKVRAHYGKKLLDSTDRELTTLYSSEKGVRYRISPFWSRGYYKIRPSIRGYGKISSLELDSSLAKFQVDRIITGHTLVEDTISVHYEGRVINVDTEHAAGKTEALLIEDDHYYRVDSRGRRHLLFIDRKRKSF